MQYLGKCATTKLWPGVNELFSLYAIFMRHSYKSILPECIRVPFMRVLFCFAIPCQCTLI